MDVGSAVLPLPNFIGSLSLYVFLLISKVSMTTNLLNSQAITRPLFVCSFSLGQQANNASNYWI